MNVVDFTSWDESTPSTPGFNSGNFSFWDEGTPVVKLDGPAAPGYVPRRRTWTVVYETAEPQPA